MNWKAIRYSSGFRLLFLVFGLLSLSACVSEEARKKGLVRYSKHQISAPVIEDVEELKQVEVSREKVARVELIVPNKGDRILSVRVRVGSGSDTWSNGADYLLAEEMESVVREASGYLFELNPTAKKYVKIVLTVDTLSELYSWKECSPWATDVTVRLLVTDIPAGGAETATRHEGRERSFSCTSFSSFPAGGSVEEALQKAFSLALVEAIKARRAGERTTASVN
ncbi:hypothetical protein [Pelagibius sp. Alg239-R121]|uniref:hypothetical protein n=1 Tax=Pelagibius sp. Alg239-R121 TaxID=2993448 RepID=UPI0024A6665F|nr:hypothetical protein [Pelagibius sp. Alg239-R121]